MTAVTLATTVTVLQKTVTHEQKPIFVKYLHILFLGRVLQQLSAMALVVAVIKSGRYYVGRPVIIFYYLLQRNSGTAEQPMGWRGMIEGRRSATGTWPEKSL